MGWGKLWAILVPPAGAVADHLRVAGPIGGAPAWCGLGGRMILTRPLRIPDTAEQNSRINRLNGCFFLYPACRKKDPSGLLALTIEEKTVESASVGVLSAIEPIIMAATCWM